MSRVRRSPRALWRRADTDVLVTLPERQEVLQLSGAAAAVWLALEQPTEPDVLIDLLAESYGLEREVIVTDADEAVDELTSLGLLEIT